MKVEFFQNKLLGMHLYISAIDFKKAKDDDNEFNSLNDAIYAFSFMKGIEYSISYNEIERIIENLTDKNGAVIIAVSNSISRRNNGIDFFVCNNNKYKNIEEHSRVIYGKYDPTAHERIKARHEKQIKDNME